MSPVRQLALTPPARSRSAPVPGVPGHDTDLVAARQTIGGFLLQLQRSHGNRFVQRLADSSGTGIPAGLRSTVERRSGIDLSGVRVHYNSPWPARLGAFACTQGSEIHVGPGQESHIAHEAWHVVQQRQGRVRVTRTTAGGLPLNDEAGLEREADSGGQVSPAAHVPSPAPSPAAGRTAPVQLDPDHVNRRLLAYRKGEDISTEDLQRLLVIFAGWEGWQLKADELKGQFPAGHYRRYATEAITKAVIQALNASTDISSHVRLNLVKAWNEKTDKSDQVAFRTPPAPDVALEKAGDLYPLAPMSPLAESYEGGYHPMDLYELSDEPKPPPKKQKKEKKEKKKRKKGESSSESSGEGGSTKQAKKKQKRKSLKLRTGKGAMQEETDVPVVDSGPEAALMIRSFQKQAEGIPEGFKIMWGPGMFHKGPRKDIVYSLLTGTSTGSFARQGGSIETWLALLQSVPDKYWQQPARFLRIVQAGLRGRAPAEPAIALVCGAMICDVKHGIKTWIQVLSELYPMLPPSDAPKIKPRAMQDLFLKWYEYHESGGRNLTGRETRASYKDDPRRVKTIEWQLATIIPSVGGLSFDLPLIARPLSAQEWVVKVVVEEGDPEMLWQFAQTNKLFYNILARRLRASRKLELT